MFKLATSHLGISAFEYYELTPREIHLMLQGKTEKEKNDLEMYSIATKVAIFNAIKGKKHKLFSSDKEINTIDKQEKEKELNELKKRFSPKEVE